MFTLTRITLNTLYYFMCVLGKKYDKKYFITMLVGDGIRAIK